MRRVKRLLSYFRLAPQKLAFPVLRASVLGLGRALTVLRRSQRLLTRALYANYYDYAAPGAGYRLVAAV